MKAVARSYILKDRASFPDEVAVVREVLAPAGEVSRGVDSYYGGDPRRRDNSVSSAFMHYRAKKLEAVPAEEHSNSVRRTVVFDGASKQLARGLKCFAFAKEHAAWWLRAHSSCEETII